MGIPSANAYHRALTVCEERDTEVTGAPGRKYLRPGRFHAPTAFVAILSYEIMAFFNR